MPRIFPDIKQNHKCYILLPWKNRANHTFDSAVGESICSFHHTQCGILDEHTSFKYLPLCLFTMIIFWVEGRH